MPVMRVDSFVLVMAEAGGEEPLKVEGTVDARRRKEVGEGRGEEKREETRGRKTQGVAAVKDRERRGGTARTTRDMMAGSLPLCNNSSEVDVGSRGSCLLSEGCSGMGQDGRENTDGGASGGGVVSGRWGVGVLA